jgi:hypothetical protein
MPGRMQGGLTRRRAVLWTATILSELPTRISNVSSSAGYDHRSDDAVPGAGVADAGDLATALDALLAVDVDTLPDSALAAAPELPADPLGALEPVLVEAARHADPARLRAVLADLRAHADPAGAEAAAAAAHDRRRLTVAGTFAGAVVLDGVLDPEGGATVLAALMPLAAPGGADDDRTSAQRRADALVELARRALDSAGLPTTAGERPHLQVQVDLATLLAGTGTAAADWAGPLSAGAALRLACDATISPVLTAGPSEVLDLGRSVRLVSPAQRRALVVRDGGCVWPDCDRPPAFTDAHHLRHWIDGGATDLANLALICRRHHRLVHTGWTLTHDPDGVWRARPPERSRAQPGAVRRTSLLPLVIARGGAAVSCRPGP